MKDHEVEAFMNGLRYRLKFQEKPRQPRLPHAWLLIFGIAMMVAAVLLMVRFVYADTASWKSLFGSKTNHIKHLDVYLPTHKQALNFGVQYRNVEVL